MPLPVTLVWVDDAGAKDAARAEDRSALAALAARLGVELRLPSADPPELEFDPRAGDAVEAKLHEAQRATMARDRARAMASLDAADAILEAQPTLPHAAWLAAEVARSRAFVCSRLQTGSESADESCVRDGLETARRLGGDRLSGYAEPSIFLGPAPLVQVRASPPHPRTQTIWLDGEKLPRGAAMVIRGRHHIMLREGDRIVAATWQTLGDGARVGSDLGGGACSIGDVGRATMLGGRVRAEGVRCADWIAVRRAAAAGHLRVARCKTSQCGPVSDWWAPQRKEPRPWWPWAAVGGAAAAITTGAILAATGAFDSDPPETRFVVGGVEPASR